MGKRVSILFVFLLLFQTMTSGYTAPMLMNAEELENSAQEEVDNELDDKNENNVDKGTLKELVEEFEQYDEEHYTEDSYAAFVHAITAGKEFLEDSDATQEDVNEAVDAIKDAVSALQEKKAEDDEESGKTTGKENESDEASLSSVQPLATSGHFGTLSSEQYEDEVELTDNHIIAFSFKVEGTEFEEGKTKVRNGDKFELKIDFTTLESDKLNFGPGTVLKYQLPTGFTTHFSGLSVPQRFGDVGTLQIDANAGHVTITLNDNVKEGLTVKDIEKGTFTISGNFSDANEQWEKEIELPKNQKFTVNFVPKQGSGVTVQKENGVPYKGNTQTNQKSDRIEWKVKVNTNLANTTDNPVFTDTLSANVTGHKYDTTSVKVYEIEVFPNGKEVVSTNEAQGITPSFDNNDTKLTITLEKDKAYLITYSTIPENPGINESVVYSNDAIYGGKNDKGSTVVNFGKAIEKEVSGPGTDLITTWTIKYNGNEQLIPSGTKLTDEWETKGISSNQTGKQVLVNSQGNKVNNGADAITITRPGGGTTPTYNVTYNENGEKFEIEFTQDFNYPITITYKTKPEGYIASENFRVENTANHGLINDAKDTKTANYNQTALTLIKSTVGSLNYETKRMEWKITANQAKYPLNAGTKFVDTFDTKNMVLVEDTLVVKAGNQVLTKGTDYTLTSDGVNGFVIELVNATTETIEITYETSFEQIKNVDEDRSKNYKNIVTLEDSGLPTDPTHSAQYNSDNKQKNNGEKTGSYNYQTKDFTWTILFNYNSNTLNNAVLKDKLPEEHEITEITLEKGHINSNGNFVKEDDVTLSQNVIGNNEFELNLGKIEQPHRLVYKTKMKDGVLPVDGQANYKVTNEAELLDGNTPNAEWKRTVTVQHSKNVLDQKNGKQKGNTETIEWNFLYNTAQSELKNVVIKDTFADDPNINAPNQIIDENSLEVYKVTYSTNGTMTKKGQKLERGTDYQLEFNKDGATFVLSFAELDYAIYVEYESVFIGLKDSPISNELFVEYNDGEKKDDENAYQVMNFTYGAFATTSAAEFVVVKIDEATGKPMPGVEFTLKNRNGRELISGKTNQDGVLDFGMRFAINEYYLDEVKQDGYVELKDYKIDLRDTNPQNGKFPGKHVFTVTNTPENITLCDNFSVLVKDVDGEIDSNQEITLTNKATGEKYSETTNQEGKITFDRENLPAGEYTVTKDDNGKEVVVDEITVQYEDNCNAAIEVQQDRTNVCTEFTITVNDQNNKPVSNVEIVLKDEKGKEITATTNNEGKAEIPSTDLPTGKYEVYDKNVFLGEVEVKYADGCEAEVTITQNSGTCPVFTLTIKDSTGAAFANEDIIIKAKDNDQIVIDSKTDGNGIFTGSYLAPGKYEVYTLDNGKERYLSDVTVDTDCEAELTLPAMCDYFNLTVKNVDGEEIAETEVTVVNEELSYEETVTTDENGTVDLGLIVHKGTYTVYEGDKVDESKKLGTFTPNDDCEVTVQPAPICTDFSIIVNNDKNNPREGVKVTVKDKQGNVKATETTDKDGKIKVASNELPAGTYEIYEDNLFLGEVKVSYKDICEAEVNTNPEDVPNVGTCPTFTLTIKDDNDDPVIRGIYTIKSMGNEVIIDEAEIGQDGQVKGQYLAPGKYKVYEIINESEVFLGTIECDTDCESELTLPKMCDDFILTVNDVDGENRAITTITVVNESLEFEKTVTTNEDGTVDLGILVPGTYTVYEGEDTTGEVISTFTADENCEAVVQPAPTCTAYTIIVNDVDGSPREAGVEITLKDESGNEITTTTEEGGKVVIPSKEFPAGTYKVYENDVELDTVKVSYKEDCEAVAQPAPTCTAYTIIVNDVDGNPRESGVEITLKDESGNEIKASIEEDGKVVVPSKEFPAGTYTVYEGDVELDTITVSYKESCEAVVQPAPTCTDFTITVNDVYGEPREAGIEITVTDEAGKVYATTTNEAGQITIASNDLLAGTYKVYEGEAFIDEIVVSYLDGECQAIAQPAPTCDEVVITVLENGKRVTSGKYTFVSEDGQTTYEAEVSKDGTISIQRDQLPSGTYTITDENDNSTTITIDFLEGPCTFELNITAEEIVVVETTTEERQGKKQAETVEKQLEVQAEKEEKRTGFLPKTATDFFNAMLVGGTLLLVGILVLFIMRRKRNA